MDLTKVFPAEVLARALEAWAWVGIGDREPLFTSLFGDVFFRADDGIWVLDILEGTFSLGWDSAAALKAEVDTPEGADRYLLAGLAMAAYEAGIVLGHDEVYGFRVSPVLGGGFDVDNLEAVSLEVLLDFLGQIHEQLHDLPPGTRISGITIKP
ncbi:T6SS immunity protein Tdi1 domain-containing protein [Fodinicola feengrottensis]|uniref:T6SS immunity protein Tdi1 domain-containing protein n=1 Tax=Fodinicola feengrottensis TaxID=435914 RepID=UPI0013D6049B|nr:T6SS immunity protein Tdi1 domain-containing protein [Fodinicola feengrottensis]